jgi:hypothetical protein
LMVPQLLSAVKFKVCAALLAKYRYNTHRGLS